MLKVDLVPSISNGGFTIFADYNSVAKVFGALPRHCNRAAKTVVSLWVSDCDLLSFNVGVSLASSSFYNYLILVLVVVESA